MGKSKQWIVTTSGERPLGEVENDLKNKGFAVNQVLDEIGCIIGSVDDAVVEQLHEVPGVTDVSPNESIDIGPPNAPVTW